MKTAWLNEILTAMEMFIMAIGIHLTTLPGGRNRAGCLVIVLVTQRHPPSGDSFTTHNNLQ